MGKPMFMDYIRHSVSFWGEKKICMYFRELIMKFGSTMDFTKDILSLLRLIASIVFNDSFVMKNYIY